MLSYIKDGVSARDVYQHAVSHIKDHKPELEKHFVKLAGFGVSSPLPFEEKFFIWVQMGVEFRDSAYLISSKNGRIIKENMVLNLGLGFTDLEDGTGQK